MPTGTGRDAAAPSYIHGNSDLAGVFNQVGGSAAAQALIQSAFDHWSQVADIEFVYLGIDDGSDFSASYAPGQEIGDIRIGGFEIDGFSTAVGFAPPPNGGTTLEGDIILHSRADLSFYVAPGAEGELYDLYPPGGGFYRNDFVGLVSHELGHALGLAHSNVPNGCMCGYIADAPGFDGSQCAYFDPDGDGRAPINRIPDADDVAGIQFLYGPPVRADFDVDGDVDGSDLLTWQRGSGISTGAALDLGDADGDEDIDQLDLAVWRGQFGSGLVGTSLTTVPEPLSSSLALLLIGVLSSQILRHRRHSLWERRAD